MEHALIGLDEPEAWFAALVGLRHPHAHTHAHVAAFAASSPDTTFLYVGRDGSGETVVACPLSIRGEPGEQDVYSPYGFGGFAADEDRPDFAEEWDTFAAGQGWVATYVLQHPCLDRDLGFASGASPVPCFVMDLALTEDELMAQMSKNRRQELRAWSRRSVQVVHDPSEILTYVLEVADGFFDDRDAASTYRFSSATWEGLLSAPDVRGFAVRESGVLVAANIAAEHSGIVDGMFSIVRPGAAVHSGPLIWEAARAARSDGATSFNLGGGVRPEDSVAAFKRRFGAEELPARSIRLVHLGDVFEDLCRRAGVPATSDGFFPPFRRRRA